MVRRLVVAALTAAVCAGVAGADVTEGLVAHYKLDQGAGETAFDSGPNKLNGKIVGAKWATTEHGPALAFEGQAHVDCGDVMTRIGLTDKFTLSVWFQPEAIPKGEPALVGERAGLCSLTYYKNGRAYVYATGNGGFSVSTPVAPGKLYHLAGTFDGRALKLYLNGELKGANELDEPGKVGTGKRLRIGGGYSKDFSYKGIIDDVRIYNRVLSGEEVKRLYEGRRK